MVSIITLPAATASTPASRNDPASRSLRLNFEIDLEVYDGEFAEAIERRIDAAIADARQVNLGELQARPFAVRLIERLLWLGSPYL